MTTTVTQALQRFSSVTKRRADFEAWLAVRAPKASWSTLNLEDLALTFAALQGDNEAVAEVDRRLTRVMRAVNVKLEDATRDDVLQLARQRLLVGPKPRLEGYKGKGALVQYLRAVATTLSIDEARKVKPTDSTDEGEDEGLMQLASADAGADLKLVSASDKQHFSAAFKKALASLSAEERVWLRMRFVDGLPIEAVGKAFDVHRTTAMRWLERAQAKLLEETRRVLAEERGLKDGEVNSLLGALSPSMSMRLSVLLRK